MSPIRALGEFFRAFRRRWLPPSAASRHKLARLLTLVALFCLYHLPAAIGAPGYLHTQGVTNLDINNNPIILRGVDLGNWLWPEYYM